MLSKCNQNLCLGCVPLAGQEESLAANKWRVSVFPAESRSVPALRSGTPGTMASPELTLDRLHPQALGGCCPGSGAVSVEQLPSSRGSGALAIPSCRHQLLGTWTQRTMLQVGALYLPPLLSTAGQQNAFHISTLTLRTPPCCTLDPSSSFSTWGTPISSSCELSEVLAHLFLA